MSRMGLRSEPDLARLRVRLRALVTGARPFDETRALTVASELGRNCLVHGGGGHCDFELRTAVRRTLRLSFVDAGPGIADLDLALADGWSSGSGMGLGLTGSRRLADAFEIRSVPGGGTRVDVTLEC